MSKREMENEIFHGNLTFLSDAKKRRKILVFDKNLFTFQPESFVCVIEPCQKIN